MASYKLFAIVLLCTLPSAFSFWQNCSNGRPPIRVESPSCNAERCVVVRGDRIIMTVTGDFLGTHHALRPRATAIFFGISVVIPDVPGHDNICPILFRDGVFHGCPVHPNNVYTWTIDMTVPNTIPPFSNGRMRVEVFDGPAGSSSVVNCFEAVGAMI